MDPSLEKNQKDLQMKLEEILGSKNVYFQPPEHLTLSYPCIIYTLSELDKRFADNTGYRKTFGYTVIFISRSPINDIVVKLGEMPYSRFDRFYIFENLNHYAYRIYN